jgi:hypothetical protein
MCQLFHGKNNDDEDVTHFVLNQHSLLGLYSHVASFGHIIFIRSKLVLAP